MTTKTQTDSTYIPELQSELVTAEQTIDTNTGEPIRRVFYDLELGEESRVTYRPKPLPGYRKTYQGYYRVARPLTVTAKEGRKAWIDNQGNLLDDRFQRWQVQQTRYELISFYSDRKIGAVFWDDQLAVTFQEKSWIKKPERDRVQITLPDEVLAVKVMQREQVSVFLDEKELTQQNMNLKGTLTLKKAVPEGTVALELRGGLVSSARDFLDIVDLGWEFWDSPPESPVPPTGEYTFEFNETEYQGRKTGLNEPVVN
ncbi:MAG: hypothetical protein ABEK59_11410 [Halobacteria archaeon]